MPLATITERLCAAELTACVICRLYSEAQIVDLGVNDLGYYCDVKFPKELKRHQLEALHSLVEEEVSSQIQAGVAFERVEMMRDNAADFLKHCGQSFLAKKITNVQENIVSLVKIGDDYHHYFPWQVLKDTSDLSTVKLLNVDSRVIWQEDGEVELKIVRVEGICSNPQVIKQTLKQLSVQKKSGALVLAQHMHLLSSLQIDEGAAIVWCSQGRNLIEILKGLWEKSAVAIGCEIVETPADYPLSAELSYFIDQQEKAEISYQLEPWFFSEGEALQLTPQHLWHAMLFASSLQPLKKRKISEWFCRRPLWPQQLFLPLWREEEVRGDCTTIFCDDTQIVEELISSLQLIEKTLIILGFNYQCRVCVRHRHSTISRRQWEHYEKWLNLAIASAGITYTIDKQRTALRGPCVEFVISDSLQREWVISCVGIDSSIPSKIEKWSQSCGLPSIGPHVLYYSLFCSVERTLAHMLEIQGKLPLWAIPQHVRVVPLAARHLPYAEEIAKRLKAYPMVKVYVDQSAESLSHRIRQAEELMVPCVIVLGDREQARQAVVMREHGKRQKEMSLSLEQFLLHIEQKLLPRIAIEK